MEERAMVGKRDKRHPGHCWQDNELYDVFQPVIGALATHVFAQMTRWCYGHEVRMGLRELAEEACVSRNTAHRATLAMQMLGMLRIREGRGRAAAAYELLDLKEAARALGAEWDAKRCSFTLRRDRVRELKKRAAAALAADRACVPVGNAKIAAEEPTCVPVRDAKAVAEESACVPVRDARAVEMIPGNGGNACGNPPVVSQFVSQNGGVCVPKTGSPLISKDTKTNTNPTPTPPLERGGGEDSTPLAIDRKKPDGAALTEATETLASGLGVSDPRQKRRLREAIWQFCVRERMSPAEAAAAMVEAWQEYCEIEAAELRFRWGPVKFIVHGHWRSPRRWPWDVKEIRLKQQARVGMR